jgi:GxxExxY protein
MTLPENEDHLKTRVPRQKFTRIPLETERVATALVDAAIAVHSELGPGLLESVCESCLVMELESRSVKVARQVAVPLLYKGVQIGDSLKLDLLVADLVVCELKAVHKMHPVYKAQLMSYLKLSGRRLGFLINFNVEKIKDGITRVIL